MSPILHWQDIALRLALTVIAGGLLGLERSKTGHAAGLRTNLLVTLAASVAMIQMNLLMPSNGKTPDSFAVMDVMRLPLGILTGVGFIGAGAILRRHELVLGITTAATLWFSTVIGLCLGGGQIILGSASTVIGYGVLSGLRWFERRVEHYQIAELHLTVAANSLTPLQLRQSLEASKFKIKSLSFSNFIPEQRERFDLEVRWPTGDGNADLPPMLAELQQLPGLIHLEWKGIGSVPN
jgi:putative Mg2+ transporter-C (MgtC) family protein